MYKSTKAHASIFYYSFQGKNGKRVTHNKFKMLVFNDLKKHILDIGNLTVCKDDEFLSPEEIDNEFVNSRFELKKRKWEIEGKMVNVENQDEGSDGSNESVDENTRKLFVVHSLLFIFYIIC